jgi:hypothetical protein
MDRKKLKIFLFHFKLVKLPFFPSNLHNFFENEMLFLCYVLLNFYSRLKMAFEHVKFRALKFEIELTKKTFVSQRKTIL